MPKAYSDRQRIEWLIGGQGYRTLVKVSPNGWNAYESGNKLSHAATARQAIDAAMRAEKKGGKK